MLHIYSYSSRNAEGDKNLRDQHAWSSPGVLISLMEDSDNTIVACSSVKDVGYNSRSIVCVC